MKKIVITVLVLLVPGVLPAAQDLDAEQLAEMQRQETFREGFVGIVDDLNAGSFAKFTRAIDEDDMLERIFGLRLIDQRVKQRFAEDFDARLPAMLEGLLSPGKDAQVRAHLLGFDSRGSLGRATVRYDLPDFQYNYHEYDLRLDDRGEITIVDWVDFLRGESFSQSMGNTLVAAAPSKQAVRKLIDLPRPSESQVFQLTELLKAARDRRADRFVEIFQTTGEALKSQRITVLTHAQLMRDTRNRRKLRTALVEMAKHFPGEPRFSLMLLDYYFPARRYDDALEALLRLEGRLGVDDSAMKARLSATALVLGNTDDALGYAEQAVAMEPGLELGWWSLARAGAISGRFSRTVEALTELEDRFGQSLGPDALAKDPMFQQLLQSSEYREWSAGRH